MKLSTATIFLPAILALSLSGCVIAVNTDGFEDGNWYSRQARNAKKIESLEIGKSEISVRDEFGDPDFVESFLRENDSYVVLFYRTRHIEHDGVTTRDETTPLVFVDGSLVGWGDSAIDYAVRYSN